MTKYKITWSNGQKGELEGHTLQDALKRGGYAEKDIHLIDSYEVSGSVETKKLLEIMRSEPAPTTPKYLWALARLYSRAAFHGVDHLGNPLSQTKRDTLAQSVFTIILEIDGRVPDLLS